MRLADALAAGDFAQAGAVLGAAGEETVNPLLGGLLAGWIEVGREDFAAASARFDAMTGNDALAAYGQYHKALALAFAGDFVSAGGDPRGRRGGAAAPQPRGDRRARRRCSRRSAARPTRSRCSTRRWPAACRTRR